MRSGTMNRHSKGIDRARHMKTWSDRRGGLPPAEDPLATRRAGAFDDLATKWLQHSAARGLSPATVESYRWSLLRYRVWLLPDHAGSFKRIAVLLSQSRVEQFIRALADTSVSSQARTSVIGTMKRFSRWLHHQGRLRTDPLAHLETPRCPRRPLPRCLPSSTIALLMSIPDTEDAIGVRDRAILELFYASGLRRKELRDLKLQDLDFHACRVRVEDGKGGKQRIVPAGQRAFAWLQRYLNESRPLLTNHSAPDSPLFVTGYGDAFALGSLGQLVRRYLTRAGAAIKGSCHLLRHSCATDLLDGGAGLRSIQRILGHSRLDTTAIYTHVSTQQLSEVHSRCHPHGNESEIETGKTEGAPPE